MSLDIATASSAPDATRRWVYEYIHTVTEGFSMIHRDNLDVLSPLDGATEAEAHAAITAAFAQVPAGARNAKLDQNTEQYDENCTYTRLYIQYQRLETDAEIEARMVNAHAAIERRRQEYIKLQKEFGGLAD